MDKRTLYVILTITLLIAPELLEVFKLPVYLSKEVLVLVYISCYCLAFYYLLKFIFNVNYSEDFKYIKKENAFLQLENKIENTNDELKKENLFIHNIYTNDKRVDSLINVIEEKSKKILNNYLIEKDMHYKIITEKIVKDYMPKIISIYKEFPSDLRYKKFKNSCLSDKVCTQLNVLITSLHEIELYLLNKSYDKLKINEKFLNEVLKNSYLEN